MAEERDWDEEMGWDRNYAKDALVCDIKMVRNDMPRLLKGKTTETIIEDIRKNGLAKSYSELWATVFAGIGISREENEAKPENIIKIGCNGFITIPILRNYCYLLKELGIEYDFLKKEYCCLAPALYGVLMRGEDRSPVDESARKIMNGNIAQAKVSGAVSLVNFCLFCCWRAKWLLGESDMQQLYAFDVLLPQELWEDKNLHLDQRVGFLPMAGGVAETRRKVYVPEFVPADILKLPWQGYRNLLNRIDGLEVIDMSDNDYSQGGEVIWEQMRQNKLDTLVVNHPQEYSGLVRMAAKEAPGIKIRLLSDILLHALGVEPWGK